MIAKRITILYGFVIKVANDDAYWKKFGEDLTALDQDLGDLFNEKTEEEIWEAEITEITKMDTLEKMYELFKEALGVKI